MTILLAKLKNCCKSSSMEPPPYSPDLASNLGSQHLFGRRFSSNSDVKRVAENWLNGHRCDFYEAGLNKLKLRSDKCLNRFGELRGKIIGKYASLFPFVFSV
ncbi:hypothetical protein AVEN_71213-1 [Araneus ventricosus]|uniref:Histone-lysine N-methyltransferase SETMAR n=1 Tax=Araneus ventricosus TaxID=182803 RepID=A0A4Y2IRW3_ARAVE|nr:hypothetical protein AVEN_71213-1 [Araneus ventricosus]